MVRLVETLGGWKKKENNVILVMREIIVLFIYFILSKKVKFYFNNKNEINLYVVFGNWSFAVVVVFIGLS